MIQRLTCDCKVKLLAKHRLMIQSFDSPSDHGSSQSLPNHETELLLLRIDLKGTLVVERHPFPQDLPYEDFMSHLVAIAEPYRPAIWDRRNAEIDTTTLREAQESSEDNHLEDFERWKAEDELTQEERCAWSYRLAKFERAKSSGPGLVHGDWESFSTREHFTKLVGLLKDSSVRPVFMRVSLHSHCMPTETDVPETPRRGPRHQRGKARIDVATDIPRSITYQRANF